jgi:drug/metabolite transporter (DMT)-like permease
LAERLRSSQRLGLLLGFLGIVVISLTLGVAYVVLAASGVAVGNVVMKAHGGRVDPLVAMAAQLLIGTLPLAFAATLQGQPAAIVSSPTFVIGLLGLALFGTALAYWLWFRTLERIPLYQANAFTFLTPFIGFALGVAFFGERPSLAAVLGLSLSMSGIVLVERRSLGSAGSWQR